MVSLHVNGAEKAPPSKSWMEERESKQQSGIKLLITGLGSPRLSELPKARAAAVEGLSSYLKITAE